jgi:hypothetical protein
MAMSATEFAEKLAAAGDAKFDGGVTKYQHVERIGADDVYGLLDDGPFVIQEKADGANVSVWLGDTGEIVIASRNRTIATGDESVREMRGVVKYVSEHAGIQQLLKSLKPLWILRVEWLVKHTVVYSPEAWNKLYVFDIQLRDGSYVPVSEYAPLLAELEIAMVPLLKETDRVDLAELIELAAQPSDLGAPQREGIVVKRYGYVNRYGRTQWGKVVNADHKLASKIRQCTNKDAPEILFVARIVTDEFIKKEIGKIEDRGSAFASTNIFELIGRVWHEAFTQELWDFVKKNNVAAFDFKEARHLCTRKTHDTALAILGGSM